MSSVGAAAFGAPPRAAGRKADARGCVLLAPLKADPHRPQTRVRMMNVNYFQQWLAGMCCSDLATFQLWRVQMEFRDMCLGAACCSARNVYELERRLCLMLQRR